MRQTLKTSHAEIVPEAALDLPVSHLDVSCSHSSRGGFHSRTSAVPVEWVTGTFSEKNSSMVNVCEMVRKMSGVSMKPKPTSLARRRLRQDCEISSSNTFLCAQTRQDSAWTTWPKRMEAMQYNER